MNCRFLRRIDTAQIECCLSLVAPTASRSTCLRGPASLAGLCSWVQVLGGPARQKPCQNRRPLRSTLHRTMLPLFLRHTKLQWWRARTISVQLNLQAEMQHGKICLWSLHQKPATIYRKAPCGGRIRTIRRRIDTTAPNQRCIHRQISALTVVRGTFLLFFYFTELLCSVL